MSLKIRSATDGDFESIWPIFRDVVRTGETYAMLPETNKADAKAYWMAPGHHVFIAHKDDRCVGTYFLQATHPGLASHIANAGFMVDPKAQGGGLGRAMANHALDTAREMGFLGMQFNLVVATNHGAIHLWKTLGFEIIGTIPRAFRHATQGLVGAHIMYRDL